LNNECVKLEAMVERLEKEKFLIERGWDTYMLGDCWVHPDSVEDPKVQDYTNYGMCLDDAVRYERLGKPTHAPMLIPGFAQQPL
jgi:hypothetical protein